MTKRILLFSFIISLFLYSCTNNKEAVELVNPMIGTDATGHTYPGATMPHGMVQLSPDTRLEGWEGCSGYHYSDSVIYGFSHTHLSGTGCSDYGDILFMPSSELYVGQGTKQIDIQKEYPSQFSHKDEEAEAGYYSVYLSDNQVKVELTTTARVGVHKYTFDNPDQASVVLDLQHRDYVNEAALNIEADNAISGYRFSRAWANDQRIFFYAEFSKPIKQFFILKNDTVVDVDALTAQDIKAVFQFASLDEALELKLAVSAVSIEGAKKNFEAEVKDKDFNTIREEAKQAWADALSVIEIEGGTQEQQAVFYTSLYHTMIVPNLYMDVDGKYRGRDMEVHEATNFDYYTVFSLWDTYRATHPLYTIIDTKRTNDYINTFVKQYEQGGALPIWELSSCETSCMIAYHSVPVIVDAYMKGIQDYDIETIYEAMKHSATRDKLGLESYKSSCYVAADHEAESVSRTLEYAYDDWCIAIMAKALNKMDDYQYYIQRAQYYKNVFDPISKFMRARYHNIWRTPFDPREVNSDYTEANAWQYSFYVPQDINSLIQYHGGDEAFATSLDSMFMSSTEMSGREQADITGLIGQYAHGNEPSHHMTYLYNYVGQAWKTQEYVRQILTEMYKNTPDGLCGNEDCGQMSAWYVFSSMGFYPVTPGSNQYALGAPLFDKITIHLENDKDFTIIAENNSENNLYVQEVKLNGESIDRSYITHDEIMQGGELLFVMTDTPNKEYAVAKEARPFSYIKDHKIVPSPYLINAKRGFAENQHIELGVLEEDIDILYTTDQSDPREKGILYTNPITIEENTVLKVCGRRDDSLYSAVHTTMFFVTDPNRSIQLVNKYSDMYSASGQNALIDGLTGGYDFRTGDWQGYQGVDVIAIVDLGSVKHVKEVGVHFLQQQLSWIFMPKEVKIFLSRDDKNYNLAAVISHDINPKQEGAEVFAFVTKPNAQARYVKVQAVNFGPCPDWHLGAGHPSWLFTDEIFIKTN